MWRIGNAGDTILIWARVFWEYSAAFCVCGLSCATEPADAVDEINRGLTRVSTDMTYETQTMENA